MTAPFDARDLAARIRSVIGVTELFPPPGTVAWITDLVNGAVSLDATDDENRIAVTTGPDGSGVAARIGVTREFSAFDTARHVADTLLAATADATVSVQVTRIT